MRERLARNFVKLLAVPEIRLAYCKWRWKKNKKSVRYYGDASPNVADIVVKYNSSNMDSDASFGCGGRMELLIYPLKALLFGKRDASVLLVGPRTEDDIFLAKSLGLTNSRGLDLFSYSPFIDLGDIHKAPYPDQQFDAVVLGWVLVYCGDPQKAIQECKRILKPGGLIAIGWEWAPEDQVKASELRANAYNDFKDIADLLGGTPVFTHDPSLNTNHHKALIVQT